MTEKIETTFSAHAEPHHSGSGFVGAYHAPGMKKGFVWGDKGEVYVFTFPEDAQLAAKDRLFDILNGARALSNNEMGRSKPERYTSLPGNEFAKMLRETSLTPQLFAELYGTTLQRVMWWIDGKNAKGHEERVPHPAYLLLRRMLDDPSVIDDIEEDTRAMTRKRNPLKEGSTNGA